MNSTEELSKYSDNNSHYRSPTLARRATTELDSPQPEKPPKSKKWSLGGLFRRRKKEETESSTEEDLSPKKGFLQRRKQRKEDKRKKKLNKAAGHFDHIVIPHPLTNGKDEESGGIFSDPTNGFSSTKRTSSADRLTSRESLIKSRQESLSRASLGSGSLDSSGKKSRREKVKARVQAKRERLKDESSSDEGSQRSTASSITRFKSDDSLSKKDASRKSRAARTERYNRRLTKEEETVLNKEAELKTTTVEPKIVNRWVVVDEVPKSPPMRSKPLLGYSPSNPLPQKPYPNISTIPPVMRTTSNLSDNQRNYFNSSHKPANIYAPRNQNQQRSFQNKREFNPEQRSYSYDCNINRSPTPGNEEEIIHVHFPIGKPIPKQRNPNLINNNHYSNQSLQRITPPPPPPRDPQRRMYPSTQYENTRPMSYAFENGQQRHSQQVDRTSSIRSYNFQNQPNRNQFGWQNNYRSNSEDHIAQAQTFNQVPLISRPASATPDTPQQRYIRRHPNTDQYKYFAEKTPRSRKPIHIAPGPDQTYLSDSQVITRNNYRHPGNAASEFWKQKDQEEIRRKSQVIEPKIELKVTPVKKIEAKDVKMNFSVLSIPVKTADSLSSLSGQSETSPLSSFFDPTDTRPLSMVLEAQENHDLPKVKNLPAPPLRYSRQSPTTSTDNTWLNETEEAEQKKRRSTNLEDALDELEAIYKSLRLGDEDLLDRAERRDVPSVVTQKLLDITNRDAQSDSGFSYDLDCVDGLRQKRLRRSNIPDKVNDDMAYRRLNRERPPPLDINAAMSNVSYILASPVLSGSVDENDNEANINNNEPDIMLDDVVYRNLKHMNNTLKIADPQPPFGIPVGPITGAANSDYLHAVPENRTRSRFIPQKSPDIVKDDLAFRSLRKEGPTTDDVLNNNNKPELALKKKRAVRSISANIYHMMHRDTQKDVSESENEFEKAQSLTDIADAMEVARQILKDRQNKIYRKSAVSDTEGRPITSNLNKSNIPTSTETLTETKPDLQQKLQVYIPLITNEATINQKPPLCPTPDRKPSKPPTKESTPNRVSPALDDNFLDNSHLEDLLTKLAIEARETSEKLGNDLKLLDEEQSRKCSPRLSGRSSPAPDDSKPVTRNKSLNEKLSDIDAVSEHAKLCEKLLGCVVESTNLISHAIPEVKLQAVDEITDEMTEPKIFKSVANVIVTRKPDSPEQNPRPEVHSESDHDYENIIKDLDNDTCISPFEEHREQLLADFEVLKKDLFSDEFLKTSNDLCAQTAPNGDDGTFNKLQDETCSEEFTSCEDSPFPSNQKQPAAVTSAPVDPIIRADSAKQLLPRPVSCGNVPLALMSAQTMTERRSVAPQKDAELRAERVARYKEERRRQLAAQFGTKQPSQQSLDQQPLTSSPRRFITRAKSSTPNGDGLQVLSPGRLPAGGDVSSSSEGVAVRTTRASRLRAARVGGGELSNPASRRLGVPPVPSSDIKERSPLSASAGSDASCASSRLTRPEKDKSSKRKSNLNRALNIEDAPSPDTNDEPTTRRRRRRVLNPNDILTSLNESGLSSGSTSTSARVTPLPSPSSSQPPTSLNHLSPRTPASTSSPRRSDLSIHMENARRGVTSTEKPRTPTRRMYTSSPRTPKWEADRKKATSEHEDGKRLIKEEVKTRRCSSSDEKKLNRLSGAFSSGPDDKRLVKDDVRRYASTDDRRFKRLSGDYDQAKCDLKSKVCDLDRSTVCKKVSNSSASKTSDVSKRMDELAALTRETLARVERLTSKSETPPRQEILKKSQSRSPEKVLKVTPTIVTNGIDTTEKNLNLTQNERINGIIPDHQNHNGLNHEDTKPSSILKKKSSQDDAIVTAPTLSVQTPVSILKRKSSQDEAGSSTSASSSFATPPVTFSPTVVDPVANRKKPGILKKRCSLDESHVIRRRSYSPDVVLVEGTNDYRPILKNQRRSSLEEIIRTRSPEYQPPGILKRKLSRGEDEFGERSLGSPEPQSILKRKSGTSSSGSSGPSPHVSIATAVILAAAGGAEIVLDSDSVKPILKKKSFSDENPCMDTLNPEVPKPILKKKSSTETDDQEERTMKPILKSSRKCSQDDNYSRDSDYGIDSPRMQSALRGRSNHNSGESSSECETMRPILKQSSSRENSPRLRLSFCNDDSDTARSDSATRRSKLIRRSNTIADADLNSIINLKRTFEDKEEVEQSKDDPHIPKRPISVFEMIMNFEKSVSPSTGAIPKRSSLKGSRQSGRFRTQPITFDEFEATAVSLESVQNFQPQSLLLDIHPQTSTCPARLCEPVTQLPLPSSPLSQPAINSCDSHSSSLDLNGSTLSTSNNDSQLTTPSSSVPNESADSGINSKATSFAMDDDVTREDADLSPQELCRSNSVSAKASMFKQLEAQMKAVAEEAKAVRLGKGNKGLQRYRNRKSASTSSTAENRFATQPVTLDEVQEAVRFNQRTTSSSPEDEQCSTADSTENPDEPDPSKLSLAERVKLFNKKITEEHIPAAPGGGPTVVRIPRHARFKTQPITTEEVQTAKRISPLAASLVKPPDADCLEGLSMRAAKDKIYEHAAKMLTSEVRGILKSKSAISPVPTSSPSPDSDVPKSQKTILKKELSPTHTNGIKKSDSSEDEGVSTEETSSESEIVRDNKKNNNQKKMLKDYSNEKENLKNTIEEKLNNRKNKDDLRLKVGECMKELEIKNKVRRHLEEVQQMSSSTEGTSDGESSGGREVKRIIGNDAVARRRQAAINRQKEKTSGQLVKSKSQSSISRDHPVSRPPLFTRSVHLDSSGDITSAGADDRVTPSLGFLRGGVRRSLTLPSTTAGAAGEDMPGRGTIADRLADLQNSGNNEWRKRLPKLNNSNDELIQLNSIVSKNIYNDSLSADTCLEKSSILAARKDKLDAASHEWKKRVESNDAVNFSVAGRMHQEAKQLPVSPLAVVVGDKKKRTPKATRFRGREVDAKPAISTPVSPQKESQIKFKRSISAPGVGDEDNDSDSDTPVRKTEGRRVIVPRPDDETFTTFFESVTTKTSHTEHLEVTEEDLDSVVRQSGDLLVTKRTVRVQRKHVGTTRNPIKALAARSDIKEEYTEIISGVAEREKRRLNVEKLAKHSSMAIEALAGLASKEDFTAIALKKGTTNTNTLLPYKDLMLLHIKGRRHVQTRLVEPVASSINKGDNYVLVTPTQVYNYVGQYSNIIEQSRGAEIAQHIQQKKDLGCKCSDVITIHEKKGKCSRSQLEMFWKLLGTTADEIIRGPGHPDEDEIYESAIIETNMVYELDEDELVPVDVYWGGVPKIEMLDSSKVYVFDFGSECYIWSGRNVPLDQRKIATKLAKDLWDNGFNYSDCTICPINAVTLLGTVTENTKIEKRASARPDWSMLCKLTQHGETILFREKFLDWPDFSRVIKVKNSDNDKTVDGSIIVKPCNALEMRNFKLSLPDLQLEGSHLGRGIEFFDEESSRHFEITTSGVTTWHILEYEYEQLPKDSVGQFYNGDSYVIRWEYMVTVTGRELSGKPSKHAMLGRDRCAYFCWQGKDAPLNEKGAAALLTVELDHERGPQIRVTQGTEPPAFLNLFKGAMTIHMGRRENDSNCSNVNRLYMCRGEIENEAHLIEVPCSMRQLRSRTSFILTNNECDSIIIWHGSKCLKTAKHIALHLAKTIKLQRATEFGFGEESTLSIFETDEGDECKEFCKAVNSGNRQLYYSLLKNSHTYSHTPRMFHLSSVSGVFKSNELQCAHQSDQVAPYPFIQNDLYSASQPTLFLIDNGHELWLWQGWWPEVDSDSDSDSDRPYSDQTGSGQHRWQAERRAAMQTTLDYWQGNMEKAVPAFLVWAGLEPLEFTNLFPTWTDRDDIAELNIRDGRKPGEIFRVETELARLTQSTYPLVQLLQRPLPEGVDPTHLEDYLSNDDFMTLLGMTKPEFQKLPIWKQTNIKKDNGLF